MIVRAVACLLFAFATTAAADQAVPGEARPATIVDGKIVPGAPIVFRTGSAELRPESRSPLDGVAETLRKNPRLRLRIEVHSDERGDDGYNLRISNDRALAIKNDLVGRGIEASRIEPRGLGETTPLCREHTQACWSKNRRIELWIATDEKKA